MSQWLAPITARAPALLHSIRFRLVLWFSLILALVLAAFSTFVYFSQAQGLRAESLSRAEGKLARIGALVHVGIFEAREHEDGAAPVILPEGLLDPADVLVVLNPSGQVVSGQGPIPPDQAIAFVAGAIQDNSQQTQPPAFFATWAGDRNHEPGEYIVLIDPVTEDRRLAGYILLASPLDPSDQLDRLLVTLLAGSLLTLVIALGGGFWLADRAMRPVQTITQAARSIGETDLSRRLNLGGRDELGELADTFDAMLARLQAAFERQRQFVADASHELRTPLTIVGLEATRALSAPRAQRDYERALGVIRAENDFMARLVNDLLTLARMDAGQAPLERKPLDLSDLALEAIDRLSGLAVRNQVQFETGDLPEVPVRGDRQSLLQMLSNLIENAIKYTAGEKKCVRVETGLTGAQSWVRVSDNGPGIPTEHLPYLFDRFYRVDAARSRPLDSPGDPPMPGGSGLGLSIVQWIAEAHGGAVRVESPGPGGTTFQVSLPADLPSR